LAGTESAAERKTTWSITKGKGEKVR